MQKVNPAVWKRFVNHVHAAAELTLANMKQRLRQARVVLAVDTRRHLAEPVLGEQIWHDILKGRGDEFDAAAFVCVAAPRGTAAYCCLQMLVAQMEAEEETDAGKEREPRQGI